MVGVLDIVALRSLTSIADSGGFRRAAENLHLSQSAVSQHVRRLEHASGRVLVERAGRGVRFTDDGRLLVADARKILAAHDDALEHLRVDSPIGQTFVIGSTEHGADLLLPAVTAAVQTRFPGCTLQFRIDRGSVLHRRLDDGALDAALLIGDERVTDDGGRSVRPAGALPLHWYAAPGWRRPRADRPLPVVVIDGPCTIRRRALESLADHDITSTVACEAGHLAGVLSAARAGVGVALLAHSGEAPEGLRRRDDLPAVPAERLHVRGRSGASGALVSSVATAASEALAPAPSAA